MAKTIVIASGKGGVGKSTVTAGLSYALDRLGKKVLTIDFDIGLKSLDMLFGVRDSVVYDWSDVVRQRCEKEQAWIPVNGIQFMPAPAVSDDIYTEDEIRQMLDMYKPDFDYILIDAPAGISSGFRLALSCADSAVVVSTPDDVCVRSVEVAAEKIRETGIEDVRLIINKFIRKFSLKRKLLNIDDVIDNTEVQLLGIVPYDTELSLTAMNCVVLNRKSSCAKAFQRISRRLTGEDVKLKV